MPDYNGVPLQKEGRLKLNLILKFEIDLILDNLVRYKFGNDNLVMT